MWLKWGTDLNAAQSMVQQQVAFAMSSVPKTLGIIPPFILQYDPSNAPVMQIAVYGGGVFIPFRDGTSGSETYGAGRYLLDTVKGADLGGTGDRLVLDFNYAYHPSCAYDPRWSCPLAPRANWLTVPVRVGERLPPDGWPATPPGAG